MKRCKAKVCNEIRRLFPFLFSISSNNNFPINRFSNYSKQTNLAESLEMENWKVHVNPAPEGNYLAR